MNSIDMIEEVRESAHEINDNFLETSDIVMYLNRGQRKAQSILAKTYPEYFHKLHIASLSSNVSEYALPNDCFELRVQNVYIVQGTFRYPLTRKNIDDIPESYMQGSTLVPEYYVMIGNKVKLFPTPSGNVTNGLKIYYTQSYPKIGIVQGSIQSMTASSLILDDLATDKNGDLLLSNGDYITICDPYEGVIKGTYLLDSLDSSSNTLNINTGISGIGVSSVDISGGYFGFGSNEDFSTFRTTDTFTISGSTGNDGDYTVTLIDDVNKRIYTSTTISSSVADGTLAVDMSEFRDLEISTSLSGINKNDIITIAPSLGVSLLPSQGVLHDFVIQYAIVCVMRKAKEPMDEEYAIYKELETELKESWTERVVHTSIKMKKNY